MKVAMRILCTALVGLIMATGPAGAVYADPAEGGNASCMAYEAADVSPPGSTSGATNQFGMPGVMNLGVQGVVDSGAIPNRGAFISAMASGHLGSHEACDEAFGLDPDTE